MLEEANRKVDLPVWIHRPSSVTGEGSSPLDLMDNLLEFSRKLRAVPLPEKPSWQSYLNFVPVEQVVRDIVREVLRPRDPSPLNQVRYLHHLGEQIPLHGIQRYLKKGTGASYRALPMGEWLKEAQEPRRQAPVHCWSSILVRWIALTSKWCSPGWWHVQHLHREG